MLDFVLNHPLVRLFDLLLVHCSRAAGWAILLFTVAVVAMFSNQWTALSLALYIF